jgi:hypothetical protein
MKRSELCRRLLSIAGVENSNSVLIDFIYTLIAWPRITELAATDDGSLDYYWKACSHNSNTSELTLIN